MVIDPQQEERIFSSYIAVLTASMWVSPGGIRKSFFNVASVGWSIITHF